MPEALFRKFERFHAFTESEKEMLIDSIERVEKIGKGRDIISEGRNPEHVHLLLEGWACRYQLLDSGKQHIMAFLIPGDLCDVHVTLLDYMDHSIRAVSPAKVAYIPTRQIKEILGCHQRIANALFWAMLVDEAILRQWLVNLGSRSAVQRIAHLICEMRVRSSVAGICKENTFTFPLTQEELGEAMGLTQVHTNRSLRKLRDEGLIRRDRYELEICDWARLQQIAGFRDEYLHLKAR
ncbi:MAG: Crp/Fnr family transcriptional regulator [Halomonas sp.]|nr:Crp/Fnr family transcriptional regulator [Halomonas sp.]